MTTLKNVEEMAIGLPQAVLWALEYRGFYDAGKYLDDDVLQPILSTMKQDRATIAAVLKERLEGESKGVLMGNDRYVSLETAIAIIDEVLTSEAV